jgi:hypothetical protein
MTSFAAFSKLKMEKGSFKISFEKRTMGDLKLRLYNELLHVLLTISLCQAYETPPSSQPAPYHTNMMSRGTKRRAAAKKAENKIKSTLKELSGWSDSEEDSFEASFHYDAREPEDAGSSSKKPKIDNTKPTDKESQKNPTNKQGAAAAATTSKCKNDTKAAPNKEVAESDSDTTEWEDAMLMAEWEAAMLVQAELKERADRRAARLVHSNRPLVLSRRLAWKLSRIGPTSPIFSPLAARHMSFGPSSVAILKVRRV